MCLRSGHQLLEGQHQIVTLKENSMIARGLETSDLECVKKIAYFLEFNDFYFVRMLKHQTVLLRLLS